MKTPNDLLEHILSELQRIQKDIPDSEITQLTRTFQELKTDVSDLKRILLNPETGVIVKVNKNTDFRKELEAGEAQKQQSVQDLKDLKDWKTLISRIMWTIFTAIVGIIIRLIFFNK